MIRQNDNSTQTWLACVAMNRVENVEQFPPPYWGFNYHFTPFCGIMLVDKLYIRVKPLYNNASIIYILMN